MDIQIEKVVRFDEPALIERLRKVTMLEDRARRPYEHAAISLERLRVDQIAPPQRYVLREGLLRIRTLRWRLAEHGVDLYDLDGFVRLHLAGHNEPIDLLPPVVEESIEADGQVSLIVCDGMHRAYVAYLEWALPQVVFIRGLPRDLPYYAFPLPGGSRAWDAVGIRDDIPPELIKKWHRTERNKTLYRDFNSAFENVGAPRGRTEK